MIFNNNLLIVYINNQELFSYKFKFHISFTLLMITLTNYKIISLVNERNAPNKNQQLSKVISIQLDI